MYAISLAEMRKRGEPLYSVSPRLRVSARDPSAGGTMLSLCELRRAARIVQDQFAGATLKRVAQPGELKLILVFEQPTGKSQVLISSKPEYARICLTAPVEPTDSPGSFFEYARAHLPGASLSGIDISKENRQIRLRLQRGSESFSFILSILGARSNLYLLDAEGIILHSMRSLDETRRELKIGKPWTDPHGAAPTEGIDRWEDLSDQEYLDAIGEFYDQEERRNKAELLARRIEQVLKKEKAFLDRKAINLQEDLGKARQAEKYRQAGELLKNVLHTVRPGADMVRAEDYQTGEVFEIPLDPKLSPAANLESYFVRYQKESRGMKMIEQQLEELGSTRAEIDLMMEQLEKCRGESFDMQALEEMAAQPKIRRLIQRPKRKTSLSPARPTQKKEIPTRLLPKRYMTQDGLEIWVGRSDVGNDYLTMRLARGNDLFFHLEGYPGSHVVLRTEGRPDPPPRSILDACELAVHFSKMKNAGSAEVHMAHIKDVKKPKGAKPGLVYVRSGKTVRLRRDPKRLQNILASRLDL